VSLHPKDHKESGKFFFDYRPNLSLQDEEENSESDPDSSPSSSGSESESEETYSEEPNDHAWIPQKSTPYKATTKTFNTKPVSKVPYVKQRYFNYKSMQQNEYREVVNEDLAERLMDCGKCDFIISKPMQSQVLILHEYRQILVHWQNTVQLICYESERTGGNEDCQDAHV